MKITNKFKKPFYLLALSTTFALPIIALSCWSPKTRNSYYSESRTENGYRTLRIHNPNNLPSATTSLFSIWSLCGMCSLMIIHLMMHLKIKIKFFLVN